MRGQRHESARRGSPSSSSPLSWSTALPPVVWWLLPDHRRRDLRLDVVAVLPQRLGRPGVLEQNLIYIKGVEVAGAVAIDGFANAGDKVIQLGLVVLRDHRPRYASLRLVGHGYETTQRRRLSALPDGVARIAADPSAGARPVCLAVEQFFEMRFSSAVTAVRRSLLREPAVGGRWFPLPSRTVRTLDEP